MRYLILTLSLVLLLGGCKTLDQRSDARQLEITLESYASTARWQPLAGLYAFLKPELQPDAAPPGLEGLRVTSYEISAPPRQLAEDKVVQTVVIQYVHVDRQVLRTLVDSQLWVRNAKGQWQRANPIPAFR